MIASDPAERARPHRLEARDRSRRHLARGAVEELRWYAQRWKIELFHKILKSGCRVEAARLRTAERLTKLIAVFCILGWRIFWTTMVAKTAPDAPPQATLTVIDLLRRKRPAGSGASS